MKRIREGFRYSPRALVGSGGAWLHECRGLACFCKGSPDCKESHEYDDRERCQRCGIAR